MIVDERDDALAYCNQVTIDRVGNDLASKRLFEELK